MFIVHSVISIVYVFISFSNSNNQIKQKISFICKCYFLETTMEKDSAKDLLGFFYDPLLKAMMLIDDNKRKKILAIFGKKEIEIFCNRTIMMDYDEYFVQSTCRNIQCTWSMHAFRYPHFQCNLYVLNDSIEWNRFF